MNRQQANTAIIDFGNSKYNDFMRFVDTLSPEEMIDFLFYVKQEHDIYFREMFYEIAAHFTDKKRRGKL